MLHIRNGLSAFRACGGLPGPWVAPAQMPIWAPFWVSPSSAAGRRWQGRQTSKEFLKYSYLTLEMSDLRLVHCGALAQAADSPQDGRTCAVEPTPGFVGLHFTCLNSIYVC